MADKKFSNFDDGGEMMVGDIPVGLRPTEPTKNFQFDFPGTGIKDSDGNYLFEYASAGSVAINHLKFISSTTLSPVVITADGGDANIDISITPGASGALYLDGLKWPTSDGAAGTFMFTNGAGVLGFTSGVTTSVQGTANQVLVNGTSGTPQTGAVVLTTPQDIATTSSPSFANLTLTGAAIKDSSGNNLLSFTSTASAANYFNITNQALGTGPSFSAVGGSTDIDIFYLTKGVGSHVFKAEHASPVGFYNGPSYQHQTGFVFAETAATRLVTFQDLSGTVAFLSDIPSVVPSALTRVDDTNVTLTLGGTPSTALLQTVSLTLGWSGTLSGARGGTGVNNGASTITVGGNFAMSGAFAFTGTLTNTTAVTFPTSGTLATTSQLPTPAALTKVDDTNVTLTLGGTPSTALLQATSITAGWTGTLAVGRGGLGISTTPSNGQIPIGNGTNYTAATLTAGTGIGISNGAGSVTISTNGANPWVDQTTSSVTMSANTGYTINNGASLVTLTLPTSSAVGDWVEINGKSSGGWSIAQASGQQIFVSPSNTTSGAGGSLSSASQYDSVRIRCITANTIWVVISQQSAGLTIV